MNAPYPRDTRAKGWRFELDHERIRQSDTWALAPAELKPWLLMLWMVAWEQTPCGSLPADDELIAVRIGMPLDSFTQAKRVLLRGWKAADDGRLYHPALTERVLEMIGRRSKETERVSRHRSGKRASNDGVTRYTGVTDGGVTVPVPEPEPEPVPEEENSSARASTRATAKPSVGEPPDGFGEFWAAYPRKISKPHAEKAWRQQRLDMRALPAVLAGIERDKQLAQWQRDGGQYIPHPATWLNGRRWEDEAARSVVTLDMPDGELPNGKVCVDGIEYDPSVGWAMLTAKHQRAAA